MEIQKFRFQIEITFYSVDNGLWLDFQKNSIPNHNIKLTSNATYIHVDVAFFTYLGGVSSVPFGIPFRLPVLFYNRSSSQFIICK